MSPAAALECSRIADGAFRRSFFEAPLDPLRVSPDDLSPEELALLVDEDAGSFAAPTVTGHVDAELFRDLASLCEAHGVSIDVFVLAAFVTVLHRVTERQEVVLCFAVNEQGNAEATLLPLVPTVDEKTTFDALLQHLSQYMAETVLNRFEADTNGGVPQQLPSTAIVFLGGCRAPTDRAVRACLALGLTLATELRLTLTFAGELYRRSTAQRLLDMVANVLGAAVRAPFAPVQQLSLLLPSHVGPLPEQKPQTTQTERPNNGTFEPVFATIQRLATQSPHRIAVQCDGRTRTYAELVERASAIAEQIHARNIPPGSHVALCLSRSLDVPAALLAIMLCGCAYVPLDPLFPADRIEAALSHSAAALLMTDGSTEILTGTPQLLLANVPLRTSAPLPVIAVGPADAAYIIYTSGSTGTPKGVVIGHGALRSLVCAVQEVPGFTADDVLVAVTTLTFDISVMDMWLPLCTGARLVLATYEQSRNPAQLQELLNASGATMLETTPGLWRALVEQGWTTHAPGAAPVRVLCGGESMSRDLADLLLQRAPEVWNMYGPTECTVWVSATRVEAGDAPPSVEDLLPGSQFYVLDSAMQPVPPGVTGELVIGGGNVGLGYWSNPELTAEKFVPNPFGPGHLYRTGDLAQLRPEGGLRLLGRADFQVKVRGFRIELGEIEHVLARHPAVREAVVVQQTLPSAPGAPVSQPLVAFLDLGAAFVQTDHALLLAELDVCLRKALPEYMVPAGIVPLPELPRLFNSKVDRNALPLFTQSINPPAEDYLVPRDFLERQLAQLWQATLGIDRIGIETSYFTLGADSLTALRLITRVNRTFAMKLGLANLLTSNSIAAMAALIRDHHRPGVQRALVPLRTAGTRPPIFMLHGVGGNILNFIGLAGRMDADQPVYALQAQSLLTGQPALLRLEDMAACYLREMRSVQPSGPYHLLGYSFGGTLALEVARQLREQGEHVALLAILDARTLAYEQAFQNSMTANTVLKQNMARFTGNTSTLSRREQARYLLEKLRTRSVRYTCVVLAQLGFRTLPTFMKVAWDINLVAFRRYTPPVSPGRLVLFRARQQEFADGPRDLGWAPVFPEGIDIYEVDSDHERIFLEPALETLANHVTHVLAAVQEKPR